MRLCSNTSLVPRPWLVWERDSSNTCLKLKVMSVLHRGKSTVRQTFPAEDVVRWKERLSTAPPEGRHSLTCRYL